jgi:cytochrome c oxidase accessory protein FixG
VIPEPQTQHQRRGSIQSDGRREKVRVADVAGRFTRWRRRAFYLLMLVYALAPLIKVGGQPLILLDLVGRRFYLFGQTFNAQDAGLLFFLLAGTVLTIFVVTAIWGRLWCGWACPQTVFLEGVFRPIERWLEGSKQAQLRLARQPLRGRKLRILLTKHALYLLASLLVANIFISYFVSFADLRHWVFEAPAEHWGAFVWMAAITAGLYFNFAWFREQTCTVLCPYGRLQSALTDNDSLVIGYDERRGEPRGSLHVTGAGDCIDCLRCVEVCPTAIDIREGLQMECIGCANCIDACDDIMTRINRPIGLIRYDSLAGLEGNPRRRWLRPRVALYLAVLGLLAGAFAVSAAGRKPFEATLIRQTGAPYMLEDGYYRNQYTIHLVNKTPQRGSFSLRVIVPEGAEATLPIPSVELDSLDSQRLPLIVRIPEGLYSGGFPVVVESRDESSGKIVRSELSFLGP